MEWQKEWSSPILEYPLRLAGGTLLLTVDETAHEIAGDLIGEVHTHSRFEMHAVLEGGCVMDVDGSSLALRPVQAG